MVDGAMFDLLHDIANSVRRGGDAVGEPVGRYSGVFGGLQVVACGDLHQLPPIQREAGMCYEAKNWTACFSLRNHMVLDSVQRQVRRGRGRGGHDRPSQHCAPRCSATPDSWRCSTPSAWATARQRW